MKINANQHPSEELQIFTDGEVLFQQGEPGGDLFFIQEGEIEIYNERNGQEYTLTTMQVGEVIGIMTCVTNGPRMASARVKGQAVVKRVPHDSLKKLIENLPEWMNSVLKDFSNRLNAMNKAYADSVAKYRAAKENQISAGYKASRMCSLLATCAEKICIKRDDDMIIWENDMEDFVSESLTIPEDETRKILAILADSGMIKVMIDPEKKKKYITQKNLKTLRAFTTFFDTSTRGLPKRLLRDPLSNKENRHLLALVKYARKSGLKVSAEVKLNFTELAQSLDRLIGQEFMPEELTKPEKLKLIKIVKTGSDQDCVAFIPMDVSRVLTHVSVLRRLMKMDEQGNQKK